ncbi:DUF1127 domain-containing protein [Chelativorans salis]|uniref:DUF1127 domain-containing protein n=1 Tax=Chelativorans salis TaxID=2978478 RepID=A0ABT2LP85_9HYPH|nr:DUF1127 domain-containing protein [Chelativorans sp. EGI FJ00035]MCT7376111.1 DUF1127 domain-containing protein [Chelativorans sp. EGI FJ00035]
MQNIAARRRKRRSNPLRRLAAAALAAVLRIEERRRQRLHLSELDDHLLADIGLTRQAVRRECASPFWR